MTTSRTPGRHTVLLQDFVNTLDIDLDEERLQSPAALTQWLREHHLFSGRSATREDLHAALALREALRAAFRGHHNGTASTDPGLDQVLAAYPLRVSLRADRLELEPVANGARGALARIVAAIMESHADGTWPRLKVCSESTCQWAFLDTSKNLSRSWCSMRLCGNRAKTRAYRARRTPGQRNQATAG
ncbi:MAG: CGNR zinc finger domain-containing protein [Streptosporangiaceae bacterium]|nr:CGNR zinc finger domain-containing protein [Streptosporangiaceae bacterium]